MLSVFKVRFGLGLADDVERVDWVDDEILPGPYWAMPSWAWFVRQTSLLSHRSY
jgi:hypothetical protein